MAMHHSQLEEHDEEDTNTYVYFVECPKCRKVFENYDKENRHEIVCPHCLSGLRIY